MMQSGQPDPTTVRVFLALCDELHFGRAGERVGLSTSRVSQTIRALEHGVGGLLFRRTSRTVELTPLGHALRTDLQAAHEMLATAVRRARDTAAGLTGVLRLGLYNPASGGPHLPDIIEAFHRQVPGCRVTMIDTVLDTDIVRPLRRGDADAVVVRPPIGDDDVVIGPVLAREDRAILVARSHPLAARPVVTYDDLADFPVTWSSKIPPAMIDAFIPPVTPSGRVLPRVEVNGYPEIMLLVAGGEAVHVTVTSFTDYYRHPGVVTLPVADLGPSASTLAWLRGNTDVRLAEFVRIATAMQPHPHGGIAAPPPAPRW